MNTLYPWSHAIKAKEYLLDQLSREEIDMHEFIIQLLDLRKFDPKFKLSEEALEKDADLVERFHLWLEVADEILSYEKNCERRREKACPHIGAMESMEGHATTKTYQV